MIYGNTNFNDLLESFFQSRMSSPLYLTQVKSNSEIKNDDYEINYTKDGAYLLYELPGFNKSNLKVELDGEYIIIEGKRTYKMNGEEITKKINQKFKVGSNFNASSVEATIDDGILSIFVPNMKKEEKKRISIL
jgi:HSP20 family molecular chaperone IbpA